MKGSRGKVPKHNKTRLDICCRTNFGQYLPHKGLRIRCLRLEWKATG